ncbi:hypothetical protein H2200_005024 [Cladophialophora chaetospira]|uniref:Uncharacterized protein n=1 Tax=Cladophialophora chaetospira TaxID=386627 RepID=A0AA39CJ73_9EURO|nr:hypothetical protein H2200_005024 [Cladophialophora chaetospira]
MDYYYPSPQQARSIRHDPRPYYDYIETGEKGHYHGFSYGKGIYVRHSETLNWVRPPSFRIKKYSNEGTLAIHILDDELKSTLNQCVKGYNTPSAKARSEFQAVDFLSHWCGLFKKLSELMANDKNPELIKTFELLMEDCLLDSRLYEGTDIPLCYDSGKIPLAHRDAVQQRTLQQDIKDIDLAVDRVLRFDDFYIMAGDEPFVTPDDFPALPQSNMAATSSTEYTYASSITSEGALEPREPTWDPIPSARSYQKVHFNPSDNFSYSVESPRNGATTNSGASDARDFSIDDDLLATEHGRDWDPSSADASLFQYLVTQDPETSANSSCQRIERSITDHERLPRTWAERLSHSLRDRDSKVDFAPDLATLRQVSSPWASHHSKLADQLKKRLKETYATLAYLAALSDDRSGPSSFFRMISSPLDLYRAGSSVLKKVMANEPPHTLRQVMSCVILAECMLSAPTGSKESMQGRYEVNERQSFLNDLSTWSSLLRTQQDVRSFDQIALALWDWTPPTLEERATDDDNNIEWKSVLALDLTQLISKTAHKIRVDGLDHGDAATSDGISQRLDTIHHDHQRRTNNSEDDDPDSPGLASDPPVWIDRFKDKYKERLKKRQRQLFCITKDELPTPQVVLLLSGAVFAAFCGFLIAWRLGLNGSALSKLASRIAGNLENEDNLIERNCVYIFLYVCIMWESSSGAPQPASGNDNTSEKYDRVEACGENQELSKEWPHDDFDWWMNGVGLACDKYSTMEGVSSIILSAPFCTTGSPYKWALDSLEGASSELYHQTPSSLQTRKRPRRSVANTQRPKIHSCRQHCGQNFTTIGNRNKHERKDCRKLGDRRARVQCQYCGKTVTRLHYAENGHVQRCREARAFQKEE